MKANQTIFVCSNCGEEYVKWQGKCESCNSWNTLRDFKVEKGSATKEVQDVEVLKLSQVKSLASKRIQTGVEEIDRVFGGGFVSGSVNLLGGEPGIGKSTIVFQIADHLENTFYVSGEESAEQIKMRADRMKINSKNIDVICETNVESIIGILSRQNPQIVIIDSIQTMYSSNFPSTAGSLVQVRECALKFQRFAKEKNIPVLLIGHVTKEGTVAGPKTLEHMVDVVLYLEGERFNQTRILRAIKNRFGATDEIGIFEMANNGLMPVSNPSEFFMSKDKTNEPGTIITSVIEGTRPILVEIQALCSPSSFGYPKRMASGFDINRLQLIIAILVNHCGLNLNAFDVYLNVAGGFYIKEPACDLAVALAIYSSHKKIPISHELVIFGELGLAGEIRKVSWDKKRIDEAKRLGFNNTIKARSIFNAIKELEKYVTKPGRN